MTRIQGRWAGERFRNHNVATMMIINNAAKNIVKFRICRSCADGSLFRLTAGIVGSAGKFGKHQNNNLVKIGPSASAGK